MTLKIAGLAVLLGAGAVYYYSPLRLTLLVLAGRGSVCPIEEALKSRENLRLQIEIKDRILGASNLIQKDRAGYNLWETLKGRFWIPVGSDYALPFNLAEQERKVYGMGERAVKPGDIVLDCGANVGVFTREALDASASLVVAIEPAPENVECLRRNFAEEIRLNRVAVYPKGVWDKEDVLTLHVDPSNSSAGSVVINPENSRQGPDVQLTTIDKVVAELALPKVDYIKMDIEGAERQALAGAQRTLAKFHPRLAISSYHRPDDPKEIPAIIRKAWPSYRMECGHCADGFTFVRPDVLFFR